MQAVRSGLMFSVNSYEYAQVNCVVHTFSTMVEQMLDEILFDALQRSGFMVSNNDV